MRRRKAALGRALRGHGSGMAVTHLGGRKMEMMEPEPEPERSDPTRRHGEGQGALPVSAAVGSRGRVPFAFKGGVR